MGVQLTEISAGKVLEVAVNDKLTHSDYEQFVPAFERLVKHHAKIRVLFDMKDFHGWEMAALWDDIKFDLRHFADMNDWRWSATSGGNAAWPRSAGRSPARRFGISTRRGSTRRDGGSSHNDQREDGILGVMTCGQDMVITWDGWACGGSSESRSYSSSSGQLRAPAACRGPAALKNRPRRF